MSPGGDELKDQKSLLQNGEVYLLISNSLSAIHQIKHNLLLLTAFISDIFIWLPYMQQKYHHQGMFKSAIFNMMLLQLQSQC